MELFAITKCLNIYTLPKFNIGIAT